MLAKKFDAQTVIQQIMDMKNTSTQYFILWAKSAIDAETWQNVLSITSCNVNADYYSDIKLFEADEETYVAEKIVTSISLVEIQYRCYIRVATVLYTYITDKYDVEQYPFWTLRETLDFISKVRRKIKHEVFEFFVTQELTFVLSEYFSEDMDTKTVDYLQAIVEKTRSALTGKTSFKYVAELKKKTKRIKQQLIQEV